MEKEQHKKLFRYRWLIFMLLALAYVFVYFHRFALSVVAIDISKSFKVSAGTLGILGSIYFYCYAFMQFPAGLISDSIGARKGVTVFFIIASIGSILFGFASSIKMALFARFLVGLGVSMIFIPTMKILSQWFLVTEFAFMASLINAMGGIGMLISTAPFAFLNKLFGWRISFAIIGVITFLIAVLAWIVVRDRPSDRGLPSVTQKEKHTPIQLWMGVKKVIVNRYFWPLAFWFFFDCGIFFGFGALWSGPYLIHVYGMSQAKAGYILSMIAVGMIAGSPLLSFLSDKVIKSRKKVIMLSSFLLFADILLLNLIPKGLPWAILAFIFFLFSMSSSGIVAIAFTTIKELFPLEITGTAMGMINLFPFIGGALFQPFLGFILDAYPNSAANGYPIEAYSMLLKILLTTTIATILCTFFMKDTFPQTIHASSLVYK